MIWSGYLLLFLIALIALYNLINADSYLFGFDVIHTGRLNRTQQNRIQKFSSLGRKKKIESKHFEMLLE